MESVVLTELLELDTKTEDVTMGMSLQQAIRHHDYKTLESSLRAGVDVDARDENGNTALHVAAKLGDVKAAKILLNHGASPNAITSRGFVERTLEMLLDCDANLNRQDSLGRTAIHESIEYGEIYILEILLEYGADVNAKDNMNRTALHFAAKRGCLKSVEILLRNNADVNARDLAGQTPLHLAVMYDHIQLLEPMLHSNVDINVQDMSGHSPLHLAVVKEHAERFFQDTFFSKLLQRGARVSTRNFFSGETPLHDAVKNRSSEFTKQLLLCGADFKAVDNEKRTPLQIAEKNNDIECIELITTYARYGDIPY